MFSHDGNLSLRQGYLTKLCPANTKSYWMLKACSVAVRIQLRSRLSMLCSIALLCSHRFSEGRMLCSSASSVESKSSNKSSRINYGSHSK